MNGKLLRAGEGAEVHRVLQHLALVVEAREVDGERDRGEEHDQDQREDDDDDALFAVEPLAEGLEGGHPSYLDSEVECRVSPSPIPTIDPMGVMNWYR